MKQWDPFRDLVTIQDRMNKLFEAVLTGAVPLDAEGEGVSHWRPVAEIADRPDCYEIDCELAGIELEQVDLRLEGNVLVVQGERHRAPEAGGWTFHRVERPHGKFLRRFDLPHGLDLEQIKASLEGGVLRVSVPKRPEARARPITVERGATRDH